VERVLAEVVAIDADEPLRGGSEDDRLLRPPAVRVAVAEVEVVEECADAFEGLDDLRVRGEDLEADEVGGDAVGVEEASTGLMTGRWYLRPVL
jgi:hypothetical protein